MRWQHTAYSSIKPKICCLMKLMKLIVRFRFLTFCFFFFIIFCRIWQHDFFFAYQPSVVSVLCCQHITLFMS